MEPAEALKIVRALAEGADPKTGEVLPEDSLYQRPEVIRAMFAAAAALEAAAGGRRKRVLPGNAGKPWSSAEDEDLKNEFDTGAKVPDMAKRHGRTDEAIAARLVRLGKIASRDVVRTDGLRE